MVSPGFEIVALNKLGAVIENVVAAGFKITIEIDVLEYESTLE
jgi:hypothetical protein